jgi:outer membrane receptor for ferrienterochelin and colicin
MRVFLLIFVFTFAFLNICLAQHGSLTGKVSSSAGVLPSASVIIKNTTLGVNTQLDGSFQFIKVPTGKHTLQISYLGYQKKEIEFLITANENTDAGTINLTPDSKNLSAVTINASLESGSETKAINMMRNSTRIVQVLSYETISKLPAKNAAEALRRMGGVMVETSRGEGSTVSLRGTPSDWTSTLVNGDRMPMADEENTTRTFEFEAFPAELIEYIEISRTVTPDQEGDNIGGIINFITKSQVDKRSLRVNVAGGYNLLAGKPLMNATIAWSDISKDKKFSYTINGSYFGRYYGAQANRLVYGNNFNHGIASFELKDYSGMKNTLGGNFAFEYKPNKRWSLGGNIVGGTMLDDKRQLKVRYNYNDGSGSRIRLQNIHGKLVRQFLGIDLHSSININEKLRLDIKVASYHNRFHYGNVPLGGNDPRNGYFFVEFISPLLYYKDMDAVSLYGGALSPNDPDPFITKLIGADNPYGTGDPYWNVQPQPINPQSSAPIQSSDFSFYQAFSELNRTRESDPIVNRIDLHYKINDKIKLQFGTKYRYKFGGRDISLHQWIQNTSVTSKPYPMTYFQTQPFDTRGGFIKELGSTYNNLFYPFLTNAQTDKFIQQMGDTLREYYMTPQTNQEYRYWVGSTYAYTESVYAAYAMADAKIGKKASLVGGLRAEYTVLKEQADTLLDSLAFDPATGYYYNVPATRYTDLKYLSLLPALNMNVTLNDKSNLRMAISRTFHRPNFEETKPGFGVYRIDELNLTFGNSKLKPSYSLNFDVMYEYYWGNKGMFSIGGYGKYVTDHIFAVTTSFVDNFGIIAKRYDNAPKSYVLGIEAGITRTFDFLPGFLSGFGCQANITYSYSRMQVPGRPTSQPMTNQTPIIYNVALFYEKYGVEARLGLNYNGSYLRELNLAAVKQLDGTMGLLHKDSSFDIFRYQTYSLDFQASYDFKKNYSIYIELMNLLDWPDITYRGVRSRPMRTEYYRQRGQIGFKYEF